MKERKITKAVIPAAGRGTRFLPATKAQPKEMLPIVDTPTIQFVVEEAVASGIQDILIITGKDKRSIEDHFDKSLELEMLLERGNKHEMLHDVRKLSELAHIHYIRQSEQLGLGHAIQHARFHVEGEPFVVLLGDTIIESATPCVRQLIDVYEQVQGTVIGLEQVTADRVSRYGIIEGDEIAERTFRLRDLIEKPTPEEAPSLYAIGGRYILTPTIFDYLDQTRPGKNGEIQLTDALRRQAEQESVYGYHFDGIRYDIGDRVDYLITQVEYALRRKDLSERFLPYLKTLGRSL
ncbi:MAG: UTP--glucose-1-phosphate uridylyltransferase GalU [Kiritimatiellae bacterium]|nr:UTP--glucose-1-phosphate uridylyltransferase GalU [Kiritimatiellia bacterium]